MNFIFGMLGFIFAAALFAGGFYFGKNLKEPVKKEEVPEDILRKREQISKSLNDLAFFNGKRGAGK